MELTPEDVALRDRYKLLIGCIVPRPIAFVSTISVDGRPNLAPFSFFNGVGSEPMTLLFCPANNSDGSEKDTLRNCKPVEEGGTAEFVVNTAAEAYYREVATASEPLPHGDSEFEITGLTPAPSRLVGPPRVAESPVAFECRTLQVIRTSPGAPAGGNVVLGRVVHIHLRDDLVDPNMHVDPDRLRAIGRLGGAGYCTTRDRFEVPRGLQAMELPDDLTELLGRPEPE
jgi:flavin reductase (DIM6/NTAB) family NADH-FMN oxidoreductase RutF